MFKVKEGLLIGGKTVTGSGATEVLTAADVGTMAYQNSATFTADSITASNFRIDDSDSSFFLNIASTSTLSADRTLTFDVDDAARILRITGNAVLSGTNTGDQTISFGSTGLTGALNGTVAGTLIPANGGTGLNTVSSVGELYYGNNGSAMGRIASVGAGNYLASNGVGAAPVWTAFPAINNGSLTLSIGSTAGTNTTISIGTGSGYSANTSGNYTYDVRPGPSLVNLAALMTGGAVGFMKKTGQDTYSLDNFSYGSGLGASTLVQRDASNNFSAGTITATLSGTASNASNLGGYPRRVDLANWTTWASDNVGPVGWYNFAGGPVSGNFYYGWRTAMADGNYGAEITIKHDENKMWFRRYAGGYQGWNEIIHSNNFASYAAGAAVSSASSATLAAKASTVAANGGNGTGMTFNWSAQGGTPQYVWGSSDGAHPSIYLYTPSTWTVQHSATCDTATYVGINYNNDSNANFQLLWGSGNTVYGTAGIYCNPATDALYCTTLYVGHVSTSTLNAANITTNNAGSVGIGDDAKLIDIGAAHTIGIYSQTDASQGYIVFGNNGTSNAPKLGRVGAGRLTYGPNNVVLDDGATYGMTSTNSNAVAGLAVHAGTNNEANKIVRTNGNGYAYFGYINSESGNEGNNSSPPRVWGVSSGTDHFMRTYLTSALSVGYATNCGNADTVDSQHFSWVNNDNGLTYVWGATNNGDSKLIHRASMSVNYANSAGSAGSITSQANSATITAATAATANTIALRTASGSLNVVDIFGSIAYFGTVNSTTLSATQRVVGCNGANAEASSLAIGTNTLASSSSGSGNTAIGYEAQFGATTGVQNTAVGAYALRQNQISAANTAIGYQALYDNGIGGSGTANYNVAVGTYALKGNTTGYNNIAVGYDSQSQGQSTYDNISIGHQALRDNTQIQNIAIGTMSMRWNSIGAWNVAIGHDSLRNNNAHGNVAIGNSAMSANTSGRWNTCIGGSAGAHITSGQGNIVIGSYTSGEIYSPVVTLNTQMNMISMGSTAVTNAYLQCGWTTVSDARDKTEFDIVPHGLDFVNKLKPISYKFRMSRDSEETNGRKRYGFKAQDILELEGEDNVVIDNDDENKLRYNSDDMIPILVNAIKELNLKIESLEKIING